MKPLAMFHHIAFDTVLVVALGWPFGAGGTRVQIAMLCLLVVMLVLAFAGIPESQLDRSAASKLPYTYRTVIWTYMAAWMALVLWFIYHGRIISGILAAVAIAVGTIVRSTTFLLHHHQKHAQN